MDSMGRRSVKVSRSRVTAVGVSVTVTGVAAIAGAGLFASAELTMFILYLLGFALVSVVTYRFPHAVLASSVVCGLAGGAFAPLASASQTVLLASTVAVGYRLVSDSRTVARLLLFQVVMGVALALRFAIQGQTGVALTTMSCVAATGLLTVCLSETDRLMRALAVGAFIFMFCSLFLGGLSAEGNFRFEGISGNPNRMVFGSLVLLPFALHYAQASRTALSVSLAVLTGLLSIPLLFRSGSSQAVVGVLVIAASALFGMSRRLNVGVRVILLTLLMVGALSLLPQVSGHVGSDADLASLSGRTPLFLSAIQEISDNPIFGTGQVHVQAGLLEPRSAHSSMLAMAASAGLAVGIAWAFLLVRQLIGGLRLAAGGWIVGASAATLFVLQFVQAVNLLPLTWVVIALMVGVGFPQQRTERSVAPSGDNGFGRRELSTQAES